MPRGVTDLPPEPDRDNLVDWLEWRRVYSGDNIGAIIELGRQLAAMREELATLRSEVRSIAASLSDDGR